jgi:hypothetical protein
VCSGNVAADCNSNRGSDGVLTCALCCGVLLLAAMLQQLMRNPPLVVPVSRAV